MQNERSPADRIQSSMASVRAYGSIVGYARDELGFKPNHLTICCSLRGGTQMGR